MHFTEDQIETFLQRKEIQFDFTQLAPEFLNKTVIVTGGGGSIGRELVSKLMSYPVKKLVLLERSELNFSNMARLFEARKDLDVSLELCDISRPERLNHIFKKYKPDIVFHAAAYKHVPILENFPIEAVINNVLATKMIADLCEEHNVSKAIFISTDKAVYPGSILGISKRLGEMYFNQMDCQSVAQSKGTRYIPVRFGNVFGSSGSVFTVFADQIAKGEAITVTHPDTNRYFMSVNEAISLVLMAVHNRIIAKDCCGATSLLNLGQPVKINDVALRMIESGLFSQSKTIPIKYVGLRGGEKMSECLFEDHEIIEKAQCEHLSLATHSPYSLDDLNDMFSVLGNLAKECKEEEIRSALNNYMGYINSPITVAAE